MAAHPNAAVQDVSEQVADHMSAILAFFKSGARITVLVRTPGMPTADFVLTSDDLPEAIAALTRRHEGGDTVRGDILTGTSR
jgi:hypothetical protein